MSAWSSNLDTVTMRSERAICNAIEAWPIKTQKSINLRSPTPFRKKMTHTTQVALAFFTNCADE
jgi:hypothetical protein